jgi:hypothetical protein
MQAKVQKLLLGLCFQFSVQLGALHFSSKVIVALEALQVSVPVGVYIEIIRLSKEREREREREIAF